MIVDVSFFSFLSLFEGLVQTSFLFRLSLSSRLNLFYSMSVGSISICHIILFCVDFMHHVLLFNADTTREKYRVEDSTTEA